jgi:hypothetical protein
VTLFRTPLPFGESWRCFSRDADAAAEEERRRQSATDNAATETSI